MSLPILHTERLYATPLTYDYLEELHMLHSDPDVMHFIRPPEKDLDESRHTLEAKILKYMAQNPGFGNWGVHLKGNEGFIGWVLLKHLEDSGMIEIGYRLHKKFWGKGYATEIAEAVRDHAFNTLGLSKIVGIAHPAHTGSKRVLEKIGLIYQRQDHFFDQEVSFFEMTKPSP